jgi:hypothetical protein
VEAASIGKAVAQYGPCMICLLFLYCPSPNNLTATKQGAIVGGQTSCKAPEIDAFEKYLPPDVDIVSCHSLHGPAVDPRGQPLVSLPRPPQPAAILKFRRSSSNTAHLKRTSKKSSTSSHASAPNTTTSPPVNMTASPPTPKP